MSRPMVKICGITSIEDAIYADEQGADMVGVVRSTRSPRKGSSELIDAIASVGIPVAAVYTDIEAVKSSKSSETYVQLHFEHGGDEISFVRSEQGKKAISVVFAYREEDPLIAAIRKIELGADLVLIEYGSSGLPPSINALNGSGRFPVGVSGRVSIINLKMLLGATPYFIDVSSSLEKSPGKKSHPRIQEFMEVVRNGAATS